MPTIKKQPFSILFLLFLIVTWGGDHAFSYDPVLKKNRDASAVRFTTKQPSFLSIPSYFIQNQGQVDHKVKYYGQFAGQAVSFTEDGVYLTLSKKEKEKAGGGSRSSRFTEQTIRFFPIGIRHDFRLFAEDRKNGKVNYHIGRDAKQWKRAVPTYGSVLYKEIYSGVDMKFYGKDNLLEYDVVIHPGADLSRVRLGYEGIDTMRITPSGKLEVVLKTGDLLVQEKPYIYQEINGTRRQVQGAFQLYQGVTRFGQARGSMFGFQVAAYNKNYPLVIDPTISYSTYLGGDQEDVGNDITVDGAGNVYVVGSTASASFKPAVSPVRAYVGKKEIFIAKIDAEGKTLSYLTFLGGMDDDEGKGIALDNNGVVWITGTTASTDFPVTPTAFQPQRDAGRVADVRRLDAFVAKIDTNGVLSYATYLGGGEDDEGRAIALDSQGNAYVTGLTLSGMAGQPFPTFPKDPATGTSSALQTSLSEAGSSDAFVTKFDTTGTIAIYSTYLGGGKGGELEGGSDEGNDIAVDSTGAAYIVGSTSSESFPGTGTSTSFQATRAGTAGAKKSDVFITKIDPTGTSTLYSTYLGGREDEEGFGIAVDSAGNAYVTGSTHSSDFPLLSGITPFQGTISKGENNDPPHDAFVVKLNSSGSALLYSTYLGGTDFDKGQGIAVNKEGVAYVIGTTKSNDFPTAFPLQKDNAGNTDLFITKIDAAGTSTPYSIYMGGSGADEGHAIAIATNGDDIAYVTGETKSVDFVSVSPLQVDNASKTSNEEGQPITTSADALIAKLIPSPPDTTPPTVEAVSPKDNSSSSGLISTVIRITFSEPINPNVTDPAKDALRVEDSDDVLVHGKLTYSVRNHVLTFQPDPDELKPAKTYKITVTAAAVQDLSGNLLSVKDSSGNPLQEFVSHFSTSDPPPPPSGRKKGRCFIATAAFGSYLDPHVYVLREFRDHYLLTNRPGRIFVDFYYQYSPPVADFIRAHESVRTIVRWTLTPVVFGIAHPGVAIVLLATLFFAIMLVRRRSVATTTL